MKFQPVFEKTTRPVLIAGPCSAETEEQVLQTAHELAAQNIDLYRAGIWKPRTRPGAFEGVGTEGLRWLRRVKQETGLKTTTEVANTQHVFEALKYGIDVLWIGARTTVNPFSVQEIADALSGVDIPVLIKNPVNADLKLWMGAIERIHKAGIQRIAVVHRGFSQHGDSRFRNAPLWQLPIELKRRYPDLQIICDHSHICGRRDILGTIAQRALDLNYDGLMTEVHPRPDEAWSDAEQQVTTFQYQEMVAHLTARQPTTDDAEFLHSLDSLRHQIDDVDEQLLQLLGSRMKLAEQIGEYKKRNNISIFQPSRWNEILEHSVQKGKSLGLSESLVAVVLRAIHQESILHQERIMNENRPDLVKDEQEGDGLAAVVS
jgi:chorismate mutase